MNTCKDCLKRTTCIKTCPEVEVVLSKLDHSLKSHYKVLFFEPSYIEKCFEEIKQTKVLESKRLGELRRLVTKFFKRLTKRQKKCLSLYYGMFGNNNYTQEEIAYSLKISQEMVHKHIYMGKKKLQKLVEKHQNRL
jgi:RNA polymerase sigma factor (sigma-70 family)